MCTVGSTGGGALGALFSKVREQSGKTAAQAQATPVVDAQGQPITAAPIGGAPRPLTANTPGQSGTGLQIQR